MTGEGGDPPPHNPPHPSFPTLYSSSRDSRVRDTKMREGGRESLQKKTGEQIGLKCLAPGTSVRPGEGEVSNFLEVSLGVCQQLLRS